MPVITAARLKTLAGKGAKTIQASVYGNRALGDTLAEFEDLLTAAGFDCTTEVAAVAEHFIARQFAAGRPDAADVKELKEFAAQIKTKLPTVRGSVKGPGSRPYKELEAFPFHPQAGKKCVGCGLCVHARPAGAIDPQLL